MRPFCISKASFLALIKEFPLVYRSGCSFSVRISKVLVANRGDSACSVIQVAKALGIPTVAVYSLQDVSSKHVRLADESFLLPGNSYLDAGEMIEIAKVCGANAIHPGIGFLSESGDFARQVEENSMCFIGPSFKALSLLGNKLLAKELAASLGIPTIPLIGELEAAKGLSSTINLFPIVIKSHCGGGGKGIRVCNTPEQMQLALEEARAEAKSSYGNASIFLEKYIAQAKHVEIQILSDTYGNVICFPERECSIQMSFQKLVEESPSSFMRPDQRLKLFRWASAIVKAANYSNVATVEFLYDAKEDEFYFMEVNCRLQVEHTLTERVSGVDLIREMFEVAQGKDLKASGFRGAEIATIWDSTDTASTLSKQSYSSPSPLGHAIQARILAQDPIQKITSSGLLQQFHFEPKHGQTFISPYDQYDRVGLHYDSLIGKLVHHSLESREECINQLSQSLKQASIVGLEQCSIPTTLAVLQDKFFNEGNYYTSQLTSKEFAVQVPEREIAQAVLHAYCHFKDLNKVQNVHVYVEETKNWIQVADFTMPEAFIFPNVVAAGYKCFLEVVPPLNYNVYIGGKLYTCKVYSNEEWKAFSQLMLSPNSSTSIANTKQINEISSSTSGILVKVLVQPGQHIKKGQPLLMVESMKMQNTILAPRDGQIARIMHREGALLRGKETLISLVPAASETPE